jgi:signal peptidase II
MNETQINQITQDTIETTVIKPSKTVLIKYLVVFLVIAIITGIIDLTVKSYVFNRLEYPNYTENKIDVIKGLLEFETKMNSGIIWGMFQSANVLLLILVSLIAVPLIVLIFLFTINTPDEKTYIRWLNTIALGFILGGAFGNLYDRFAYGAVRDFIHYYWLLDWPTFNLADFFISLGVLMMLVTLFRKNQSKA